MASKALRAWRTDASGAFDQIEHAHHAVCGGKPGRRFATQQLNYAYVTLLAARFQGFVRELHSETADVIANGINPAYKVLLVESLTAARSLDRASAHPNVIAESFRRLGFDVWHGTDAVRSGNDQRRRKLTEIITWRNAIAHDDINAKLTKGLLVPTTITLDVCRRWRSALNVLAGGLDITAADRCEELGFARPW